jgi:hypothetical protein
METMEVVFRSVLQHTHLPRKKYSKYQYELAHAVIL